MPLCDDGSVISPAQGLARLRAAAGSAELAELCGRHQIGLLTVFGSAARREPTARDLDIGVFFEPGSRADQLGVIGDLVDLTEADVDVVHLNRGGPVIRERALVGSIVLHESRPGLLASAQIAAVMQRMDTDWLRRLDLDLLAR